MKKKIIIVEDDDDSLFMMVTVLQNHGYEVLGLTDGSMVMEDHCNRPDLFILDKEMDNYDGVTITRHLKTAPQGAGIPIMMISGFSNTQEAVNAGVDLFLSKPIDTDHLLTSVNDLLAPMSQP